MSISSLGRSIAAPSLREPVSPLMAPERSAQAANATTDLASTQVAQEVNRAEQAAIETEVNRNAAEQQAVNQQAEVSPIKESVEKMTEILSGNSFELSPSGPLSRPDFKVIDRVNNIDFERVIPPQALQDRIFELREEYIAGLSSDRISFDTTSPLGRRVLVIKESLNQTEFVRHLPASYNEERVAHLTSFASQRGFDFEAVA